MKYTPEERMDIGRRVYEREMTCQAAAEVFGIHKHTAKRYLWMYRDTKGLPPKTGRPEGLKITSAAASELSGDITEYENMSREELIRELVLSKINEERAKKGYEVKGVGAEKKYIKYVSKNIK